MGRVKAGGAWTLLYVKGKGRAVALAQVHLTEGMEVGSLRARVMPEIEEEMGKRVAPWSLVLQEDSLGGDQELWEAPEARRRHLEALWAWWDLHKARGGEQEAQQELRRVHAASLEACCACLLGRAVSLREEALNTLALGRAVERWLREGEGPQSLEGVETLR